MSDASASTLPTGSVPSSRDCHHSHKLYTCSSSYNGCKCWLHNTLNRNMTLAFRPQSQSASCECSCLAAQVKETMGKFEERLWSIIRNFIVLGRANPALLVSAVRVVEMQETVDKQIAASGKCAQAI